MGKRKVAVVTGSRAEYGLLHWLMKEIQKDETLSLQTFVTGMHLSPEFGLTYRQMEADGFEIDRKVEMLVSSDTPTGVAKSMGLGIIGFADAFASLRPDLVVVLGDRFEILAAAQAAMMLRLPIAHIHGGESTEGMIDEAVRHALTKMAHLHFTAAEPYRRRVVQLGEHPDRVFNFGAIGLDNVVRLPLLSRTELEESLGFGLGKTNFLVTFHPVTLDAKGGAEAMDALLTALDEFPEAHILFTKQNADSDGHRLFEKVEAYVAAHPRRAAVRTSLGQRRYLSAVHHCDVVVGNSSSGILEVPAMGRPTVDIGTRQQGRLRASSVIHCLGGATEIASALRRALSPEFRKSLESVEHPYGNGGVSERIVQVLRDFPLDGLLQKRFYDWKVGP